MVGVFKEDVEVGLMWVVPWIACDEAGYDVSTLMMMLMGITMTIMMMT
jgi:hypothetical protein